jgi:hypothetical protein
MEGQFDWDAVDAEMGHIGEKWVWDGGESEEDESGWTRGDRGWDSIPLPRCCC